MCKLYCMYYACIGVCVQNCMSACVFSVIITMQGQISVLVCQSLCMHVWTFVLKMSSAFAKSTKTAASGASPYLECLTNPFRIIKLKLLNLSA